jgi:ubiquitin thioesterase OTU1
MAGTPLTIRIRTKKGMFKIQNLTSNSTLNDLKKTISDLTGIQYSLIKILKGYPPKNLDAYSSDSATLSSIYIKDGDLLTIEEGSSTTSTQTKVATATPTETKKQTSHSTSNLDGILLRKVVPANNSCLFTSIYYVIEDGKLDLDCQKFMRDLIAQTVKADQNTFNEGVLGKENKAYCDWIKNQTTWGGQIEVSILSKYYKIEICVVDIQTCRIDRFGEDCNYPKRVFIIYDGIHFDPLYLQPLDHNLPIRTKFSTQNEVVMHQALELANESKKAKEFTDVLNLKLRCLSCQKGFAGQKEAQEHAKGSGHINFGEF